MTIQLPGTPQQFLEAGQRLQATLRRVKSEVAVPDYGWYPYEPLSALPLVHELIAPVYDDVMDACSSAPVADLGCADGDLAMMFARMGVEVDAIDHRESNYNQMRGVEVLRRTLNVPVRSHDIDLDAPFELPRPSYGLSIFLGTLYHLKNPFYVLEKLAGVSDCCL